MKTVNNKILVSSNVNQKDYFVLGGITMKNPVSFDSNYRQRSPVMCQVEEDCGELKKGAILLCHHNTFYLPSPYHVGGSLFSIPCNGNIIFAKMGVTGDLWPLFGNMFCTHSEIKNVFAVSEKEKKHYTDRAVVSEPGFCNYKKGQLVFTRPSAPYEIVYMFDGVQKSQVKVHESMIAGVVSG